MDRVHSKGPRIPLPPSFNGPFWPKNVKPWFKHWGWFHRSWNGFYNWKRRKRASPVGHQLVTKWSLGGYQVVTDTISYRGVIIHYNITWGGLPDITRGGLWDPIVLCNIWTAPYIIRDGSAYQNKWTFGKLPKGVGGFQSKNLCCTFCNFSETSSLLVAWPVPKRTKQNLAENLFDLCEVLCADYAEKMTTVMYGLRWKTCLAVGAQGLRAAVSTQRGLPKLGARGERGERVSCQWLFKAICSLMNKDWDHAEIVK